MSSKPRVAFVLEQSLGHVTHNQNLARLIAPDPRIDAAFAPIEFEPGPRWAKLFGFDNWTVRSGVRARRAVRQSGRDDKLDALFVHTQVPAMLMPDVLRRIPSVLSLDATPIQYDELGRHYGHFPSESRVESAKWRLHRTSFARARRIVTWSEWAKQGLVDRYEVAPEKVVVIPPGVDSARWSAGERAEAAREAPVRILFVGGDFARKGGPALIDAVRRVRADGGDIELDVVTREPVLPEPGVRVHHGVAPNSTELIDLYWRADIFCLPTLADCFGLVLLEAGVVGLPLVSTDVGAISEVVRNEETGLLVPPGDDVALASALERLASDAELRRTLGRNAQRAVRERFDAAKNAALIVGVLVEVADGH